MKIIGTPSTNIILEGNGSNILSIPATLVEYVDGDKAVEICFELSQEEINVVSQTHRLYLTILGTRIPPVNLDVVLDSTGENLEVDFIDDNLN